MHNKKTNQIKIFFRPTVNMKKYGQRLAQQILVNFIIDPPKETKPIWSIPSSRFPRKLNIKNRNRAIFEARKGIANLKLRRDIFKLDNAKTGVEVGWKKDSISEE